MLARSWYEVQRPGLGNLFESEILSLLRSLESNALIYARVIDHSRCAYARRLPYVITYEIRDEDIVVVSVLHTKRRQNRP